MVELHAAVRLRPTRIALLTRPTDAAAIRQFMRACAALWGGAYNPIIPVFRTPPLEWKTERSARVRGYGVAKGYVEFFEPDAFVEAEKGLLRIAGLEGLESKYTSRDAVLPLRSLLRKDDHRDWAEPRLGLGIYDAFNHAYETERRFQLKQDKPAYLVLPVAGSLLSEAVFGVFPGGRPCRYISQAYDDVYSPKEVEATPDLWKEVFLGGAMTPLRATRYQIERQRYWHHQLVVFLFDPNSLPDVIDLWNIRLEAHPILPLPVDWLPVLAKDIRSVLKSEHRPLEGNPNGVMRHATVEFARSISEEKRAAYLELLRPGLRKGALMVKPWRTDVWVARHNDDFVHRDGRLSATTKEQSVVLDVDEKYLRATFQTLSPDFASRYGGRSMRWINAVKLLAVDSEQVATVLPFNTFDRSWPRIGMAGEATTVGSEGWTFAVEYKDWAQPVQFLSHEDAIVGTLKQEGVKAVLSEPGHIAKQVLANLRGLWGVSVLGDRETLEMLNTMAGGIRTSQNSDEIVEQLFDRRSKSVSDWQKLVSRRTQRHRLGMEVALSDFTDRNVLRLGLQSTCPHCSYVNWHSIGAADYNLTCERCLREYPFPQSNLRPHNQNWAYRVVGPFSVPDYARGSYGALLAAKTIHDFASHMDPFTLCTALALDFDGHSAEVDFVALQGGRRPDQVGPPEMIIGEAKSLGERDLIKENDLAKLRLVGAKLPGAIICLSVLRDDFTENEKTILRPFVRWGRRIDHSGEQTNPVILMTGREIFAEGPLERVWKELGGRHAELASFHNTRNLRQIAAATQSIYLEMPAHHEERAAHWKRVHERRAKRTAAATTNRVEGAP